MANLSSATEKLVRRTKAFAFSKKAEGSTIHVDYIASKVASFYEKIRKVLEYQEEHLFRKNAIDRSIKRRLLIQEEDPQKIAQPLIAELIRAGYLPNDTIAEDKIEEIRMVLDKYVFLINYIKDLKIETASEEETLNWLINLASCEVEDVLAPPAKDNALAEHMYETIRPRISVKNSNLTEEEINTQTFIGVQKALLRSDDPLLNYRLIKWHFPEWNDSTNGPFFTEIAPRLLNLKEALASEINHPSRPRFFAICNQYNTPFLVLGDALIKDPELLSKDSETIENAIDESYQQRFQLLKSKIKRAAIYATLSIFVTKVIFAILIEVPIDLYIIKELNPIALIINIIFPPFLMFLIVMTVKPPKPSNGQKVILETMKAIYEADKQDQYDVKPAKRKNVFLLAFINLFYTITSLAVFWLIVWGLLKLKFSIASIVIFLVFISLIFFAGIKIRQRSKELNVEETKDSAWIFVFDLIALPLIGVGKWLSGQWARINFLVVIFNFILEVPFQIFIEFIENWRNFLKEKKEDIER